ncbi:5'-hydroxyaverantin dehydrogenase [Trichoderma ghanense]|uniref:5'-hydroxyaverantin dehydrogenase n=1 Tax=Trichoderma ghanense TaxID=65468 RepID=A0ABY2GSM1_9HYPO
MGDARQTVKQSLPVDVGKPYDPTTLKGKTILITGGANGLGSHMVRHWASHGANVVIGDVADTAGEELVASLQTAYPEAVFEFRHCDVTDWESQVSLFDAAVAASPHGAIDVVVPNAGVILPGEATKFENPGLVNGKLTAPNTTTLSVNVKGVIFTSHLALYHLPQNKRSDRCLLFVGSVASLIPLPGQSQYTTSKHAVLGLFRSLRGTAFMKGIRVNMIAPYYTAQTKMLPPVTEALLLAGSAGPGSVPDVIDAATRLVADESIVGRALVIGPRLKAHDIAAAIDKGSNLMREENGDQSRAIWECYAHDYDQVETFVRRYLWLLNATARARGMFAWIRDILAIWKRG